MTQEMMHTERYRPQFHFTARENWLNDPNGCLFHNGEYHQFFQHNPEGREWGNMTWGHAVSPDLVRWRQLPNALFPYDGGTVYSGSAVEDPRNLSGFGEGGVTPLVAAFTHARKPFGQALAYSVDQGRSWKLHDGGRHVVPNQGLDDGERDPKIFWHSPSRKWIMVLWVRNGMVRFFTSDDLRQWARASDFIGEGFYECPDLFELPVDGDERKMKWVLHDAAFRYWVGAFDGTAFRSEAGPFQGDVGHNFYAAQTWSGTGRRVVQIACLGKTAPLTPVGGLIRIRLLVDRASIELFGNDGEVSMSSCFLPERRETTVRCQAEGGAIEIRSLTIHRLHSAWK